MRDLDGRIAQLDAMVKAATARGYTKSAMRLVDGQAKGRAELVAERQQAAERLADLKVQQADVEAQRARTAQMRSMFGWTTDAMPSLYTRDADRVRLAIEGALVVGNETRLSIAAPSQKARRSERKVK